MERGKVSTNVYLRRIHNFALAMNWLPVPVIPKRQWPEICHKEKRAWQDALNAIIETKNGSTKDRWVRAAKEKALDAIRSRIILETQAAQLLACFKAGSLNGAAPLADACA